MRVGLIGYGAWGRFHARALRGIDEVELAAILCPSDATAAAAARDHPGVPVVRDLDALLALPLDAVDITAPNHLHAPMTLATLEAGRHVIVEKPLATSAEDCARIVAASRATGRLVCVNHELRASVQWGAIGREIAAGAIGAPVFATFTLFRRPFRPGASGWRHDAARVGSWSLEELVHFFDLLLWYFTAAGDPVSVRATAVGGGGRLPTGMTATVRYPGGAYFTVTQALAGFGHHCALEMCGTDGALRSWWSGEDARTDRPSAGLAIQRRGAGAPETTEFPRSGEVFELQEQLRRAVEGFRAGASPMPPEEAQRAVLLCLAADQACHTGQEVPPRL